MVLFSVVFKGSFQNCTQILISVSIYTYILCFEQKTCWNARNLIENNGDSRICTEVLEPSNKYTSLQFVYKYRGKKYGKFLPQTKKNLQTAVTWEVHISDIWELM